MFFFFGQAQIIHTHTAAVNIKFTFCYHSTIVVRCAPYKTQVVYSASLKTEPERNHYLLNACGVYCLNATAIVRMPGKGTP